MSYSVRIFNLRSLLSPCFIFLNKNKVEKNCTNRDGNVSVIQYGKAALLINRGISWNNLLTIGIILSANDTWAETEMMYLQKILLKLWITSFTSLVQIDWYIEGFFQSTVSFLLILLLTFFSASRNVCLHELHVCVSLVVFFYLCFIAK